LSEDGKVDLWDPSKGNKVTTLEVPKGIREHLVFSPDSRSLAVQGGDFHVHVLTLRGQEIAAFRPSSLQRMWYYPRGNNLAIFEGGRVITIWNVTRGQKVQDFEMEGTNFHTLAFDEDQGRMIIVVDNKIQVYDVRDWKLGVGE
jgi:WD40 repeat protein